MSFASETPVNISRKQIMPKSFLDVATKTPQKVSLKQKYAGWIIDHSTYTAELPQSDKNQPIQLKLLKAPACAIYDTWWPRKPIREPQIVIGGCCLLDGRWQIEFAKRAKKSAPARRMLSNAHEREDAIKRLRQGQKPTRIYVPCSLGEYHRTLIKWQATQIKRLHVTQVFYNIPTEAYRLSVTTIENELGFQCPQLHETLNDYAVKVEEDLKRQLGDHHVDLCVIDPIKEGKAKTALESYLYLYMRIKDYCTDPSRVVGVEDLRESRLAREASVRTGVEISVLGAVLGIPHPFTSKTLSDGHFKILELN